MVCSFDATSPRINAHEIHEWLFNDLKVNEHTVLMIQIDGAKRQVFVKFIDQTYVNTILQNTNGSTEYRHTNGILSQVKLEEAGLGSRRVRVANLPPELPNALIRTSLLPYGTIHSITDETWPSSYRYTVANGVRVVQMTLNRHLPSNITMAGYRAFISYEGQPQTCFGCGATEHVYQTCPSRKHAMTRKNGPPGPAWNNHDTQTTDNMNPISDTASSTETAETTPSTSLVIRNNLVHVNRDSNEEPPPHNTQPPSTEDTRPTQQATKDRQRMVEHYKWADEPTEDDMHPSLTTTTSDTEQQNDTEWPSLPATHPTVRTGRDLPPPTNKGAKVKDRRTQSPTTNNNNNPKSPGPSEQETARGKKQRLEKSSERTPDPKRTRGRYGSLPRELT